MDFADYNNDGYTDAVVTGDGGTIVYKNDGLGNMINISIPNIRTWGFIGEESERQVQWVDMDKDGDKDILVSYGIFENVGGSFRLIRNTFPPFVHADLGDINNDGFKDLITVPRSTVRGPMHMYIGLQGTGFFKEQSMGTLINTTLQQYSFNNSVLCFDIDNDGDDDILYSGGGNCTLGAQVIVNENFNVSNPVPVTFLNFYGIKIQNNNRLNWETQNEINNNGFEVQRSDDGENFSKIAFINSNTVNGSSNTRLSYKYDDNNIEGTMFYRLKQLDKDENFKYSNIIKIERNEISKLNVSVYPNPVRDNLKIIVNTKANDNLIIELFDVSGKCLIKYNKKIERGANSFDIPFNKIFNGVYILKVTSSNNNDNYITKVIKYN